MKIKWWSSISFYGSEKVKINRCPGSYNKSNGITYEINKQNQPHPPPPSSLLSIENRKRQIQTLFRGRFIHRDVNLLLHSAISICVLLCEGGGGGNTIINFTMIIMFQRNKCESLFRFCLSAKELSLCERVQCGSGFVCNPNAPRRPCEGKVAKRVRRFQSFPCWLVGD